LGGNLVGKNNWAFFLSERDEYLHLLQEAVWPKIQEISDGMDEFWFQQDGAPPHYDLRVWEFLIEKYPNSWIGRYGPVH
jgi:hypothetical protein